jgi:hypothetical protein
MGLCQTTQGASKTKTKRANERVKRMQEGGGGGSARNSTSKAGIYARIRV